MWKSRVLNSSLWMTSSINLSSFCHVDYTRFCLKAMGLYTMFSLNFSSAGKGPFIASKAKKVCQRQQFKLFDSNNFTLSLLCYLSKMHNPQQEKLCTCVLKYFSISIYSFSFWEVDSITTSFFSKSTFFYFSKPTSGKKAVRSKVNSTGYCLIRRMWCMGF